MRVIELSIDCYSCQHLNNSKLLMQALTNASKAVGAHIVRRIVHKYRPFGLTVVVLLAETHASISTWPEYGYATVNIFLCNEKMDPHLAWKEVRKVLRPKRYRIRRLAHTIAEKRDAE